MITKWKAHTTTISRILVSQDDGLVITAGADGLINVWMMSQILAPRAQFRVGTNVTSSSSEGPSVVRPFYSLVGHINRVNDLDTNEACLGKL